MLHRMYILELLKSSFQLLLVILRVYFVVMHLHNTKNEVFDFIVSHKEEMQRTWDHVS